MESSGGMVVNRLYGFFGVKERNAVLMQLLR